MKTASSVLLVGLIILLAYSCRKKEDNPLLKVKLTAKFESIVDGLSASFKNRTVSLGDAPTYHWDFGDSTVSTITSPSHTYEKEGSYIVKLTATQQDGVSTFSDTVNVEAADTTGNETDTTNTGDDTAAIVIDGDFSDWANMDIAVTNNDGAISFVKAYMEGGVLYVYVEGKNEIDGLPFHVFLNTDDDSNTGFNNYGGYPLGTGADYMYQGDFKTFGELYKFSGAAQDAWGWDEVAKMGESNWTMKVSDLKNSSGGKAWEFSIDLNSYITSDTKITLALESLDAGYNTTGSLPKSGQTDSKYYEVGGDNSQDGDNGNSETIAIDGDFSDWDNVPVVAENPDGALSLLKTKIENNTLYVYIEGSDAIVDENNVFHWFFNTDNDESTGLLQWTYGAGSGADYFYEGNITGWGNVYQFGNTSDINAKQNIADQSVVDLGLNLKSGDISGGKKAIEFSFDISPYTNGDHLGFAVEFMENWNITGSLPKDQQADSKFAQIGLQDSNEDNGGNTSSSITIDGDLSDWADIDTAAKNSSGFLSLLKVSSANGLLYLYVEGTGDIAGVPFHIFFNTDEDGSTGFDNWGWIYPDGHGADYMYEGDFYNFGNIGQFTGASQGEWGWSWVADMADNNLKMTVSALKDITGGKKAFELSIDLSAYMTGSKVGFAIESLDTDYQPTGFLPEGQQSHSKYYEITINK